MLPSQTRRRRALPPHGYEGMRATACPIVPPMAAPALPSLPDDAELARRGFTFAPVGPAGGTVRLFQHGRPLGVFINRAASAPTINRYSS